MKWFDKKITLPLVLSLALVLAGVIATFARLSAHAEDSEHPTAVSLQTDYVPRKELDHRLDSMELQQQQTYDGVQRIEQMLMEGR